MKVYTLCTLDSQNSARVTLTTEKEQWPWLTVKLYLLQDSFTQASQLSAVIHLDKLPFHQEYHEAQDLL